MLLDHKADTNFVVRLLYCPLIFAADPLTNASQSQEDLMWFYLYQEGKVLSRLSVRSRVGLESK